MQVLKQEAPVRVQETPLGSRSFGRAQRNVKGRGWHMLADSTAPVALLGLFVCSGPLLEQIDPNVGVPDVGSVGALPLALLVVAVARRATAGLYKPLMESVGKLSATRQAVAYGCLYLAYFWAVIWTVVGILLLMR